jgi:hypothetical protein
MPRDPTTARLVDQHVSLFRAALVAAWAADESAHPGSPGREGQLSCIPSLDSPSHPMADAHLAEPTFTATMTRDGTYCVQLDQHADAPVLHIGSFDSEGDAQTWIRDDSVAWLTKRRPRETVRNRRRRRIAGASGLER